MPDQDAPGFEHTRKLANNARVVRGMRKEAERGEEVDHRVEPARPFCGQFPHVPASVSQVAAGSAFARNGEQLLGVIEAIDIESVFRQEVSVPSLPARNVQNARASRQAEQIDEPCYLLTISLGCEERSVFQEIVGVEGRLPPLGCLPQKNTGSR